MKFLWLLLPLLAILSCNENQTGENVATDSVSADTTPGYPAYSVHPEIDDINVLRELLLSADSVIGGNMNGHNGNTANGGCESLFNHRTNQQCGVTGILRKLSRQEIDTLIAIITDTTTYTGTWSGLAGTCFLPHLGFAFFKDHLLVAQVSVCFLCSAIRTFPHFRSDELTHSGGIRLVTLSQRLGFEVIDGTSDLSY
jgi:hypothetical protein